MWRAHPITPAIIVPLSFDPWRYADTSLPIDPMPLLAFAIASFSRPRPVVKGLVDLRATLPSFAQYPAKVRDGLWDCQNRRPGE